VTDAGSGRGVSAQAGGQEVNGVAEGEEVAGGSSAGAPGAFKGGVVVAAGGGGGWGQGKRGAVARSRSAKSLEAVQAIGQLKPTPTY
jgi:hypothetical protein